MFLWFIATAVLTVFFVFTDPRFDYRLLVVGALLPDLIDAPFGGARVMHSLTSAVAVLVAVMLVTAGRKPIRRMLLPLPIGLLLHLVFDGAFNNSHSFLWPFLGGFEGARLPIVERGWLNVPMEIVGLGLSWWCWKLFGLRDPTARRRLRDEGRLTRVP